MKKFLVILITLLCFFPINVFASGSISVNRGSLSIAKGSSSSFVVSANNAAGRVDIYSSNSSVAKVSTSSSWLDNNSVTVTVTGVNDGNATIIVKITDAATYDEEALSGTRSVSVNVYSNTSSNNVSNNNSQNSNQSKPSNSSKYNNSSNTKKNEPIKNDATLSSLNVKNYDIGFDKNKEEYNIEIENYINSLDIDAKVNMTTSKVNIEGNKDLKVGDNTINVIVTSEDGTKKTYKINVKRKDEVVETTIDKINEVEEFLQTINSDITVAVMGCAVNGPGEASNADIGIAGGIKEGLLFKKGKIIRKIPQENIVRELKEEILKMIEG